MRWRGFIGIAMICGYLIAFALGVYGGAVITVRHYQRADVLETKCIEALPELNDVARRLDAKVNEVIEIEEGGGQ